MAFAMRSSYRIADRQASRFARSVSSTQAAGAAPIVAHVIAFDGKHVRVERAA
jgi:hypothetical protein